MSIFSPERMKCFCPPPALEPRQGCFQLSVFSVSAFDFAPPLLEPRQSNFNNIFAAMELAPVVRIPLPFHLKEDRHKNLCCFFTAIP